MDEGTSIFNNDTAQGRPSRVNNRLKDSQPAKKVSINQIKKSPAIPKMNQAAFNSIKNYQGLNINQVNSFAKRGSLQTTSQPTLSIERISFK